MKRIAIVGGGISGLAAAFALEERRRAGDSLEYAVYESGPRFGGVLATEQVDGCLVEAGPDSFLTEKPWAADLCRRLGIEDQLIGSSDSDRKTYILVKGKLIPSARRTDVHGSHQACSRRSCPRFFRRPQSSAWCANGDWLRAGPGATKAWPRWWTATTARRWSIVWPIRCSPASMAAKPRNSACAPCCRGFVEMESKYGSLGRGMLAARKKQEICATPHRRFLPRSKMECSNWRRHWWPDFPRMPCGQTLRCRRSRRQDRGWVVSAGYASDTFDAVIVATPATAAVPLLEITCAELASELKAIPYSSSMTVALGFDQDVRAALPPGFGFLVPRSEGKSACWRRHLFTINFPIALRKTAH